MGLLDVLSRRVFVPLYERKWGLRDPALRRRLEGSQFAPEEEVRALQWTRLEAMLRHASRHSPFHRERWARAGISVEDVRTPDDFARLPLLTKDDLRDHGDALLCEGLSKEGLRHKRTGGSTGVPVHVYWDDDAVRFKFAVTRRHDRWAGHVPGAGRAALWGDTEKSYSFRERVFRALYERTVYLDTLKLTDDRILAFVDRVRRSRPPVLFGHAHSIYFFARFLEDRGIDDVRFRGIISTAETLVPEERRAIEGVFGPVVFDRYGCEEVSLIASECEAHDGLHTSAEGMYVEVLGGDARTPGRLVVTDLVNRAMPLVRYEVGDLATTRPGLCACGRGLPRLGRVHGRTTEFLVTPEGRRVSGVSILDTFMIHIPGIKQAQIVQDRVDHVVIRVLPDGRFGDETRERLRRTVGDVFGPRMRHEVEVVEAIPRTARGKFQFTISLIGEPTRHASERSAGGPSIPPGT